MQATRSYEYNTVFNIGYQQGRVGRRTNPRASTKELPAASSWGANELFAFRVVVEAADSRVLPHLTPERLSIDALIAPNSDLAGLAKSTPPNLPLSVEMDLSTKFGHSLGQFWAALADVVADEPEETDDQGGLAQDGVGEDDASTAAPPPAAKDSRPRNGFAEKQRSQTWWMRRTRSSALQALAKPIPRSALTMTPSSRLVMAWTGRERSRRSDWSSVSLECRGCLSVGAVTVGGRQIRAEDDGGLRLRMLSTEGEHAYHRSRVSDCYHLLSETKRRFQHHHEGRPPISDAWLGQKTAEALVARLVRRPVHQDPVVVVIAAARRYVRFLQFRITDEYLRDVETRKPQLTLPVTGTVWLDLGIKWTGRAP
ncbi:Uu.00g016470.m01.CDS01 [Anthostomella pinea]|uniref:Uu.00g016470.m01.CDS01 n=1 Tax=Anthostomella pinea TaxID=933095 RepID=A0AAI8VZY3_9PEZI|nr:Uu.00g016470.m01.CDS01 [Anthostomella pinea]